MSTTEAPTSVAAVPAAEKPVPAADRFMRRILRVSGVDKKQAAGAHRAFRNSILITAVRCLITYLAVPLLVPVSAFAGWIAAPISIALCLFAFVNGVISVRRFWISNHRHRWMYTWFMAVVFVVLTVAIVLEITRLVTG